MKTRYATITEIKPNYKAKDGWGYEKSYIGYVAAMDGDGVRHLFMNGTMTSPLRQFPDLKEGDVVKIAYEKGGNYALWFVKEVLDPSELDTDAVNA